MINFEFSLISRHINEKVLNFISLLKPAYSGGITLRVCSKLDKPKKFALLACLIGKVRVLLVETDMNFVEFFFLKKLFSKNNVSFLIMNIVADVEVCSLLKNMKPYISYS